jgi:hypothetical protein
MKRPKVDVIVEVGRVGTVPRQMFLSRAPARERTPAVGPSMSQNRSDCSMPSDFILLGSPQDSMTVPAPSSETSARELTRVWPDTPAPTTTMTMTTVPNSSSPNCIKSPDTAAGSSVASTPTTACPSTSVPREAGAPGVMPATSREQLEAAAWQRLQNAGVKKSMRHGSFVFWVNTHERVNEPPHVHVLDMRDNWEGRLDLVTGSWLDVPRSAQYPWRTIAVFDMRRADCIKSWEQRHGGGKISAKRHPQGATPVHGYQSLIVEEADWSEYGVSVRFSDGHISFVPATDLPNVHRTLNTTIRPSKTAPHGIYLLSGAQEGFLPADWLRSRSDGHYRARMTWARIHGAVCLGDVIARRLAECGGLQPSPRDDLRSGRHDWIARLRTGKSDVPFKKLRRLAAELGVPMMKLVPPCPIL